MNRKRFSGIFMPIMFDAGTKSEGGDTKAAAELRVKELAEEAFKAKASEFVGLELKSDAAKDLIKAVAEDVVSKMTVKDTDGKEKSIETIVAELQKQHDKLSTTVKNSNTVAASGKTFEAEIKEQLTGVKEQLKNLKENKSAAGVSFDMKAAATMLIATNYTGGTVGLTNFDNDFARLPRRQPFMRELVRVLTTDNMYIAWAEQANADPGVAGTVAEGAPKPQTDFDIVERSAKVEKIAVWIKVSKEALADIKFLQSEINTELRELVELKLDEQILNGNGTSPNLRGILTVAPTFAAVATLAAAVPDANRFDVIMAAVAQIAAANFTANAVVVNPADFFAMQLVKDGEGRYLLPPFSTSNGLNVAGLRVVANNGVAVGSFLVGDFTKDNLAIREEVNIQIGYENDDFTRNLVTILAEMRAVNYIKTNHLNAFVKGTFSAGITALTPAA